jgi:hypothetical protein
MDMFDKLQQLLDFLNIPGPVSKYLPAKDTIPLRNIGVLDLHVEVAARRVVDLILNCSMHTNGAAFFSVRFSQEVSSHYEMMVYALRGGKLSSWPKGSTAEFGAGFHLEAVRLPVGTTSAGASIPVVDMLQDAKYGTYVKVENSLFKRINTVLHRTLGQVPVDGKTGALKTDIITAKFSTCTRRSFSDLSGKVRVIWW